MNIPLWSIIKRGLVTQSESFPDLPQEASGLPMVSQTPCQGMQCRRCMEICPMGAITINDRQITLDRGLCLGCGLCYQNCPSETLTQDRSTRTAVLAREDLILTNQPKPNKPVITRSLPFLRSLHIREVSTGDNACDLEAIASSNPIFDISRFGVFYVASPRFADALLVTGPVGKAMQEPLRRCYNAMTEPKIVIAAGVSSISGGLFRGGYAEANGVPNIMPVDCFIPGDPPHPWSIIHGIMLAMGKI